MTAAEPLDSLLARARATESVFTSLTADRAHTEEGASAARRLMAKPLGPLEGKRVTWKDLFDVAGTPTTCGSRVAPHDIRTQDADAVTRMATAGAVCVGKTNLSEFAFSGLGVNPHFGTPRNPALPADDDRVCGGSSSGAAAAVALGLCDIAVGTDTSGSVRVPASFTGLVGFRASSGRYPTAGLWTLSPTLDTIGLLACQVDTIAAADAVLAKPSPMDSSPGKDVPRFVIDPTGPPGVAVDPAVEASLVRFAALLRDAGYAVDYLAHDHVQEVHALFARHGALAAHEALQTLGCWLKPATVDQLDPRIRERLQQARDTLDPDAAPLLREARRRLIDRLKIQVPRHTVFVSPTTPGTAPTLGEATQSDTFHSVNWRALSMTMPGSFLDMSGLALPSGADDGGAPTSVLLSVPQGRDAFLLQLGCRLEHDGLLAEACKP